MEKKLSLQLCNIMEIFKMFDINSIIEQLYCILYSVENNTKK